MSEVLDISRSNPRVVTIAGNHPCLPGHFPRKPIVPAVVILDEVRAMIGETHPGQRLVAIDHCKFQDFVLPDCPFEVTLKESTVSAASTSGAADMVDFACSAVDDGRLLASGRIRLA